MESIVRNVKDIQADDRRSLEHVVGQHLQDNQQVIIRVLTVSEAQAKSAGDAPASQPAFDVLPDWCDVYEGLSDEEIAEVEASVLDRSNWTRPSA